MDPSRDPRSARQPPARWSRVEALYHEARALSPDERAAYVRSRTRGEDALEREVMALLGQPVSADPFLEDPALDTAPRLVSTAATPPMTGRRLGVYRIQALIGAGGMGEVYRAHDSRLGRDVALKVLPAEWSADRDRLRRFANEARAAGALNHPHICTIYDIGGGERGEPAFIAMELLEGESVQERLAHGPMDVAALVEIGMGLADALDAAHTKHILHRDIKPANIFLGARGAKIVDFGLAKTAPRRETVLEELPSALTETGFVLGTVAYMSPEQLRGEPLDGRSDLFSLGLVLYEMATGRRAFPGGTASAISGAILHTAPIAPRQLRPELPAELERIVLKAIEKDRDRRYQSAADLRSDLMALQRQLGSDAVRQAGTSGAPAARHISWRTGGLVIAALVLLFGGAAIWWSGTAPDTSPAAASAPDGPHRLVVLPFDNVSGQPEDGWLSGAFADSLTLGLRDAENLVLVDRARVLELGAAQPGGLDDAAFDRVIKTLAVRYYVNGSYQRVGDNLRVVARLVNADARTIAMQESLTDRFANLLQMQDDLAGHFARALPTSPAVARKTQPPSLASYRDLAEANDLYLTGRYDAAITRLERVVKQDEAYPDAWALLGKSYGRLATPFHAGAGTGEQRQALAAVQQQALTASLRAVELNPSLYEAQVSLALAYTTLLQNEPAARHAQRAIDLNPRLPEAYQILGSLYTAAPIGPCTRRVDYELAERHLKKALELDPLYTTAHHALGANLGWLNLPGTVALKADERKPIRTPDDLGSMRGRAAGLMWNKHLDDAEEQLRWLAELSPPTTHERWVAAAIDLLRGDQDAEQRLAAAIEEGPQILRELDTVALYGVAGNPRMAAVHLARLFRADPACTELLKQLPGFVQVRTQPEVQAVIRKYSAR